MQFRNIPAALLGFMTLSHAAVLHYAAVAPAATTVSRTITSTVTSKSTITATVSTTRSVTQTVTATATTTRPASTVTSTKSTTTTKTIPITTTTETATRLTTSTETTTQTATKITTSTETTTSATTETVTRLTTATETTTTATTTTETTTSATTEYTTATITATVTDISTTTSTATTTTTATETPTLPPFAGVYSISSIAMNDRDGNWLGNNIYYQEYSGDLVELQIRPGAPDKRTTLNTNLAPTNLAAVWWLDSGDNVNIRLYLQADGMVEERGGGIGGTYSAGQKIGDPIGDVPVPLSAAVSDGEQDGILVNYFMDHKPYVLRYSGGWHVIDLSA